MTDGGYTMEEAWQLQSGGKAPAPIGWGLWNAITGRWDPRLFVREEIAKVAAERASNQWRTLLALPLYATTSPPSDHIVDANEKAEPARAGVERKGLRRGIALEFLSRDLEVSREWLETSGRSILTETVHKGDCPKAEHQGPITCNACCAEEAFAWADRVLALIPDSILATLPYPGGWRPIADAPKDGTVFLAWPCVLRDFTAAVETYWYVHPSVQGWITDAIDCNDYEFEPTHWMPLPSPPAGEG